uniref:Ig-like domain-containing protein n=1 Tax=Astyanax mexicanus TaxID=7994 RepID=W5LCY0_ASTMX
GEGLGVGGFLIWNDHVCVFLRRPLRKLQVVGPSFPLTAAIGEDLILPCSLQPNISAVDMTVEWLRLDQKDSIVHLYMEHEDRSKEQAVSYRGRTQLFKEELQKGNTSLKLSTVHVSDTGQYKCVSNDVILHVIIYVCKLLMFLGTGTDPVITVEQLGVSGGISLMCESKGWNPEPEILWLNSEGAALNAEATETERHSEGITVKRRVTVYKTNSNRFYCRVKQEHHMKQTEIIISGNLPFLSAFVQCKKVYFKLLDVIMDINTAHPYLNLSENEKQVKYGKKREDFSDHPLAFDDCVFILGTEGFQRSFYFEVQVRGKTDWTVGVAKETIKRKGEIILKPTFGFWTLSNGNTMYDPSADVYLRQNLQKVGVFLNYEEGTVSFYDVDANFCVKHYKDQDFVTIDENLYPIFSPGLKCVELSSHCANGAPLSTCSLAISSSNPTSPSPNSLSPSPSPSSSPSGPALSRPSSSSARLTADSCSLSPLELE